MRHSYLLLLLLLVALPSCHTRRKAQRRREAEQEANNPRRSRGSDYKYTTPEYIETYKYLAVREMHKYGIPASIILAQAILESNNGNSDLARYANNHFGVKSTKDWYGDTYYKRTDEDNSIFRKYASVEDSYKDHSEFLSSRPRYADLFRLRSNDYKGWAYGLKKAGYATNPKYPELLINLVEKYELWRYD